MTFAPLADPGLILAMAAAPNQGASPLVQFIPFVLVLAIFYFIILLPMKRRQKKVEAFLGGLKVGDKVVTTGGIYGSVTRLEDQTVQLQIAQNVRVDVARTALVGYQGQPPVASDAN
ncbi:MAG: preprotein translocase subunit YajC [Vicinamibacterales bacterium]